MYVYCQVLDAEDGPIALGIFSTEETAWSVLRAILKRSAQMTLDRASLIAWDLDVVGEAGMTVLSEMICRSCPVCPTEDVLGLILGKPPPSVVVIDARHGWKETIMNRASSMQAGHRQGTSIARHPSRARSEGLRSMSHEITWVQALREFHGPRGTMTHIASGRTIPIPCMPLRS